MFDHPGCSNHSSIADRARELVFALDRRTALRRISTKIFQRPREIFLTALRKISLFLEKNFPDP